jgi:hypothetical protein
LKSSLQEKELLFFQYFLNKGVVPGPYEDGASRKPRAVFFWRFFFELVFFFQALSEDLMKMERLESLALWRCDMTADTMRDIAPGLSQQDVC